MSAIPEKVFTAPDLTPVKKEALTPVKNEALTLVKPEASPSCQACGAPGPVFECPECNTDLCSECYDNCQLAHWGDSDTRREQLAGIGGAR